MGKVVAKARPSKVAKDIVDQVENELSIFDDFRDNLNKRHFGSAFNLEVDEDVPCEMTDFISTGSVILDTTISNNPNKGGGFPVGRISQVVGENSSGKSLMGLHAVKSTQDMGGVAVYIDVENSFSVEFAERIGIDLNKLVYCQPTTMEEVFDTIETIVKRNIELSKTSKKKRKIITVIWDSVAATPTADRMEKEYGSKLYGPQAAVLASCLPKIRPILAPGNVAFVMLNQLRQNMQMANIYSEKFVVPCGEALKFWISLNIFLKRKSKILIEDLIMGYETEAILKKNRVSGDGRRCSFDIYFNRGIYEGDAFFNVLKKKKVLKEVTAQKSIINLSSGPIEFKNTKWEEIYKQHSKEIIEMVKKAIVIDLSNPDLVLTRIADDGGDDGDTVNLKETVVPKTEDETVEGE